MTPERSDPILISIGIAGLDDILNGGLITHRLYLVEGTPGSGKTTLALQFVREGVRLGDPVLYITLTETRDELLEIAASHGWTLDGVTIRELIPTEASLEPAEQYTLLHPADVELIETTKTIQRDVERVKPTRVVLDSLSELRFLAGSALRYRHQVHALKSFFAGRGCTVLMLDDLTAVDRDLQFQSIVHGVVQLEQLSPEYGAARRRLKVLKYRSRQFRGGYHDFVIQRGGLVVFPRLVAAEHGEARRWETLASGIAELDALLAGGIDHGTSTLIVGAAGTGKSTLATQFIAAGGEGGKRGALFVFDESLDTMLSRSAGLGIPLREQIAKGRVTAQHVSPGELAPGEFAHAIRLAVERNGARVVVIDSLNSYLNAMPEERFLVLQLRELLMYLGGHGVATLLVAAQRGVIGSQAATPIDASYLADAVVLLRYFEAQGEVRQAISVVKKRSGEHERTIREFRLAGGRIRVGEPLREFRGVLTGVPSYGAGTGPLTDPGKR